MLNYREMPHKAKPTVNQLKFPEKEISFIYFSHPLIELISMNFAPIALSSMLKVKDNRPNGRRYDGYSQRIYNLCKESRLI